MNRSRQWRVGAVLVPLMALILTACGGPDAPSATSTPVQGATPTIDSSTNPNATPNPSDAEPSNNASGSITLYTTRSEALIKPVIEAFQQANPGTEVKLLSGSAGNLGAKLLEERRNPQADVYITTDILNMSSLAQEKLFTTFTPDAISAVPAQYRAEDGSWTGLTLRARVIMYNTNLVSEAEAPKSVFDLTDPKWQGQIGSADSNNGSFQAHIAAIRESQGDAKAEEFLRGLVANNTRFLGGHTDVRKAVGAGEMKLGFVNHYYYQLSKAEGAPVGVIYPDQGDGQMGVVVNATAAAILKGASNEPLARKFVSYLLTPEGQKSFADLNYEYPVISGVTLAEGVRPLDGTKLADVTFKTMWEELQPTREMIQKAGVP
jgi:iron(III) transport system substrate-binding protein